MPALPIDQWLAALDKMENAIATTTRGLDRAEERWEMAGAPSAGEGELPPALARLDVRDPEWELRLRAAEEQTAAVEKELTDRAGAVSRWRLLFARWEELLKRTEHVPSGSVS